MAVLHARADGNLSAAATWGVCDATALLDSEANNTVLTTAYVESQAFTPGAITIDGIAVKVASRPGSTGTISIRLAQAGALVAGTEVTINVSDIDSRAAEQGWYFFKFAAPVLLVAATAYTVSAKTSNVTQVNLYRNATAGNWSRLLRTTTTGAPAAGDSMHISGEWTAAATKTDRAVTQDLTAATDFGDNTPANPPGMTIGKGGTLTWGTTAATNYLLRLSTKLFIYRGGTMNMGTTGTQCPRDSSMQLEFDVAVADGDFGMQVYGTLNCQGLSRTSGKDIVRCLLNTDEAAAQTVLGVDTDTGWKNGDDIALASTTQTASQAETRTLSADAGASSVTVGVGLTNAHSGTSPTQAEVLLLTRNVRIQSVSTTLMAYVYFGGASTVDCDWTAFRYLGHTVTGKRGVEIDTTSAGSCTMSYCAIREFDNHGIYVAAAASDNWSIDNLTGYKVGHQATNHVGINVVATTGINWSLTNIDIVSANTAQGAGVQLASYGGTLTNIRCNSGGGDGLALSAVVTSRQSIHRTWSGFDLHSNGISGLSVDGLNFGKLSNVNIWRNLASAAAGLFLGSCCCRLVIETGAIFGNAVNNISMATGNGPRGLVLRSVVVSADTTFAVTNGLAMGSAGAVAFQVELDNCTFGVVSGIKAAHTNDINCATSNSARYVEIVLRNTNLASATEVANQSSLAGKSFIKYQRTDQVTNVHKTVYPNLGTIAYETTTFRTAAPSQKLSPSGAGAGEKLESGPKRKRIANGATVAISVYVRKSAGYTGSAPRLVQRANPAIGVNVDTVIATHSAAADTWQQLSGTVAAATENGVAEFFVDCDGSAGDVYVDDWS
jgi:hypothetical protein